MFCKYCGSSIPDGARFCTECGTQIAAAPTDDSAVGYSTVSGYVSVPVNAPEAARRPLYKRWWFWLILAAGVVLLALLIFAALIVFSMRNTMPQTAIPEEAAQSFSELEDIEDLTIPELGVPELQLPELYGVPAEPDDAFPLDADDQFTPMDILLEQIELSLTDTGLEHDVWADEDDWVYINVWADGLASLAEAACSGDEAAIAQWQDATGGIRAMSEDYLAELLAGGQHNAVCVVSLLDDTDSGMSLAVAVDGELILDPVTGLDEYGLLEE